MSLTSGFYNAFLVNNDYDRKYNADDYSNNIGAFIRSGVLRDGNDGLKVSANGLVLTVATGRAWIEGHWVYLDTPHTFPAITPPVGDYSRIDTVVLRLNTTPTERNVTLIYVTGTPASTPTPTSPTRGNGIYDIVLANITVAPSAVSVTVTDKRPDKTVCGWVTSPIGYDDYFTALDVAFNEWFEQKKDTLATVTLFKDFKWRTVLTSTASAVTFDIPQYDPTGVDIIQVFVNGLLEIEGIDYTLNNSTITFSTGGGGTGSKVAGTEIVVICWKAYDGSDLGSVSDRIDQIETDVAKLTGTNDYTYVCNGVNDNVKLSEIAQAWLDGGTDYGSKIIRVYGTFGASAAYAGSGTSASPYRWFSLGSGTAKNRKIIFDFSACSQISINCASNTYNVIFYGLNVDIIGVNCIATGGNAVYMFSTADNTFIHAENCRFWITSQSGYIARGGTFKDCRISLTCTLADAYAFNVLSAGLLRLYGGEYYAYAATGNTSAVIYVSSAQTDAVVNTYSINCPTVARGGYVQSYSIYCLSNNAACSFTDTITTLAISAAGQNVRGTIAKDKVGLM